MPLLVWQRSTHLPPIRQQWCEPAHYLPFPSLPLASAVLPTHAAPLPGCNRVVTFLGFVVTSKAQ